MSVLAAPKSAARAAVRRSAPWLLWPTPASASSLQIERKYWLLRTLDETRDVPGAVVEIGCYLGGTAAMASAFLRRTGTPRAYVCVDTFSGFVAAHLERETAAGMVPSETFDENGVAMVSRLLEHWGASDVKLVQADVCSMRNTWDLPRPVAVCLVDVDLEEPVVAALKIAAPRMAEGGVILVDDCPEGTSWEGARRGYENWCADAGRPPEYLYGFGVARF